MKTGRHSGSVVHYVSIIGEWANTSLCGVHNLNYERFGWSKVTCKRCLKSRRGGGKKGR